MRLTGIILITVSYLITFTEFDEVFRLPLLFGHYQEHRTTNPDTGMFAFFLEHYCDQPHKGQHSHDDLPFSHSHSTNVCQMLTAVCPDHMLAERWTEQLAYKPQAAAVSVFLPEGVQLSIWQPPRVLA